MFDLIQIADRLLEEDFITQKERKLLVTKDGQVVDDTQFNVEVCENGDVYIHRRGPYPLILPGYARKTNQ